MNLILTVHFNENFHEIFLPAENNRRISYVLPPETTGCQDAIRLDLSLFEGIWHLKLSAELKCLDQPEEDLILNPDMKINLLYKERVAFAITTSTLNAGSLNYIKFYLPQQPVKIGKSEDNDICIENNGAVSGHHALLVPGASPSIQDISRNGTFLNENRVIGSAPLAYGDEIDIFGVEIIYLGDVVAISTRERSELKVALKPVQDTPAVNGQNPYPYPALYERSPRSHLQIDENPVELEAPPAPAQQQKQPLIFTIGPSITMVIPMAAGVMFTQWAYSQAGSTMSGPFMYMGIVTSVTSAIIGVAWALANNRYNTKVSRENELRRKEAYRSYLKKMRLEVQKKQEANLQALAYNYPDNQTVLGWIQHADHRLWENNEDQPDFMTIRLGNGNVSNLFSVQIPKERFSLLDDKLADEPGNIRNEYSLMKNAPVCLSLNAHSRIGICGRRRYDIVRILVSQLMSRYSYTELKMAFLYDRSEADFTAMKWLPHTWMADRKIRLIADDRSSRGDVLYALAQEYRIRLEDKKKVSPHYLLFIDHPSEMEDGISFLKESTGENGNGFSAVYISEDLQGLPNDCNDVLSDETDYAGFKVLDESEPAIRSIQFDYVDPDVFLKMTRMLSNYRVRETGSSGAIPDLVTYLDLYHVSRAEDLNIRQRWLEDRTYESMKALIGLRAGGEPVYLDINEKYHGPHGLVAGTTGSGKSELLQTYILSLAISFHPYEVSFILIDYKGGGMAQSFEKLPHVAGIITNLGGNQTSRALASINSEIRRRQAVFNENKVKHIDEYTELYRSGKVSDPIPHLIIIADEFAELKKEQPDFVRELVSTSRIGRSLGVHLILATQKPAGVVDDEIWGNSRFRICLRVQDKQDSNDMLKRTDAAYITNVGRAFMQVGNNEIFEEFQSAWSGAKYNPADTYSDAASIETKMIGLTGKNMVLKKKKKSEGHAKAATQLEVLVAYISQMFAASGQKALKRVWLPPLPERISLDQLAPDESRLPLTAVLGLVDDPNLQSQYPFELNLVSSGHTVICGSASSGKTTLLQTMLYSLLTHNSEEALHVYIADFGSRTMGIFRCAPQVGSILYDTDHDRIAKLFKMLMQELKKRKLLFSSRGIGTFREYASKYSDVPALLLAIDNFPAFYDSNENCENSLYQLTREAASYGMYLVVTCQAMSDIKIKIRQNFTNGIGLQLPDRYDYEEALGEKIAFTAEDKKPGRGMARFQTALEFQAAVVMDSANSEEISAFIQKKMEEIGAAWTGSRVPEIPSIPEKVTAAEYLRLPAVEKLRSNPRLIPVGYDVSEVELATMDLADTLCVTIGGSSRTGKTNFLKYLILLKENQNADLYVVDSAGGDLETFAQLHGAKACIHDKDGLFHLMQETILKEFVSRNSVNKKAFIEARGSISMDQYLAGMKPIYVLINDMPAFLAMIDDRDRDFIRVMLEKGAQHGIWLIGCIAVDEYQNQLINPIFKQFISWKDGIHFGGLVDQQRIFDFDDITPSVRMKKLPQGEGFLQNHFKSSRIITPKAE